MLKKNKAVAIVGSHPGTRDQFDFKREDIDIWVFNEALATDWCIRADVVFQMHEPAIWKNPKNRNDPNHAEWLMEGDTPPIVMMEKYEEVPQAVRYPIEEIQDLQANTNINYFTSSVAYAIALAIHLEYERIEIYGVEMETDTEYKYQRAGVGYWVGIAIGKGIDVYATCEIFKEPMYGYEGDINIPEEDYHKRVEELAPQCEIFFKEFERLRHNFDVDFEHFIRNPSQEKGNELIQAAQDMAKVASMFGAVDGARQENQRYISMVDKMKEISGGDYLIVRQQYEQAGVAEKKKQMETQHTVTAMAGQMQEVYQTIVNEPNMLRRRNKGRDFTDLLNKWIKEITILGVMDGSSKENYTYSKKLDMMSRAAGGSKSEEVLQGLKSVQFDLGSELPE